MSPAPSLGARRKAPARKTTGSRDERIRKGVRNIHLATLGWNFVTAPLVGGGMGYGIDWLLGSYPWAMVVALLLGFVSAFIDLIKGVR